MHGQPELGVPNCRVEGLVKLQQIGRCRDLFGLLAREQTEGLHGKHRLAHALPVRLAGDLLGLLGLPDLLVQRVDLLPARDRLVLVELHELTDRLQLRGEFIVLVVHVDDQGLFGQVDRLSAIGQFSPTLLPAAQPRLTTPQLLADLALLCLELG